VKTEKVRVQQVRVEHQRQHVASGDLDRVCVDGSQRDGAGERVMLLVDVAV
jgi:hypothetical protein